VKHQTTVRDRCGTRPGRAVDPLSLPLSPELSKRVVSWAVKYAEDKIPIDGAGDTAWLEESRILLRLVRRALRETHDVIVTEPWWNDSRGH
jgi:hypothetical protein